MQVVPRDSVLWSYLTPDLRDLILDGEHILTLIREVPDKGYISDYSFVVFSFSKAYEGFLKKFFLDSGLIKDKEYLGDDLRIGRVLNPHYIYQEGNVFAKICDRSKEGKNVSERLWRMWKRGRNLVFHYFPHNYKKLTYEEALNVIHDMVSIMETTMLHCEV